MRVAIMQPKTKNRVISAEPREAISPFRLSAPSTLGANEYTAKTGMMEHVQKLTMNSIRLP
ncbi:hypothetical protein D3C86_2221450 [compost metagenome]